MSNALRQPMTLEAFLAWEREQEFRWEFDGWAPVAMTGGTVRHSEIATNLVAALRERLRGTPCRAFRGDLKILADGRVRYPDAAVSCSPVPGAGDIIPAPVVVFEVLSASTARTDRVTKNAEYRRTASIQHYVMFEQDEIAATLFSRIDDDWVGHLLEATDVLALPAIGVTFPLRECYADLDMDSPADD